MKTHSDHKHFSGNVNNRDVTNTCELCGLVFHKIGVLLKHKMKHSKKGFKISATKNIILMNSNTTVKKQKQKSKTEKRKRFKRKTKNNSNKLFNKEFESSNFFCNVCDFSFIESEEYVKHTMSHVKRKVEVKLKKLRSKLVKLLALKQDYSIIPIENNVKDTSANDLNEVADYTSLNNFEVIPTIPDKVNTIIKDQKSSKLQKEKSKPKNVGRFKEVFITNVKVKEESTALVDMITGDFKTVLQSSEFGDISDNSYIIGNQNTSRITGTYI